MIPAATFDQIYRPLRQRAYELAHTDHDADDLTQETLTQLLERPPGREGTPTQTLRYARLRMGRIFIRDFLGVPRRRDAEAEG